LRGEQQVVFARPQRYRRFDQVGETAQRVIGLAGMVDRGSEVLGDALIEGRADQIALCRKPAVEGSLADAGAAGASGPSSAYTSRAARRMRSTLRAASARNGRSSTAVMLDSLTDS